MRQPHYKTNTVTMIIILVCIVVIPFRTVCGQGTIGKPRLRAQALPRLIDIGAKQCIPCKMMAPILEELKREYAGVLKIELIDVWEDPDAGQKYDIWGIPTQIFYDASGKELYRHAGFISKEQILNTFKNLGIDLKPTATKKKKR